MRKMLYAKGVLTPANPVTDENAEQVEYAVSQTATWLLLEGTNTVEENGTITIDTSVEAGEAHHSILSFVKRLHRLLEHPDIAQLRLNGFLMITADTSDEPFVMRVSVKDGTIFYQDAHITWSQEVPF